MVHSTGWDNEEKTGKSFIEQNRCALVNSLLSEEGVE
jgi:hypothetical protein